jgi:hypothetical protein
MTVLFEKALKFRLAARMRYVSYKQSQLRLVSSQFRFNPISSMRPGTSTAFDRTKLSRLSGGK